MNYNNWTTRRIRKVCEKYEDLFKLFSRPNESKAGAMLNFVREIGELIGYSASGGGDED